MTGVPPAGCADARRRRAGTRAPAGKGAQCKADSDLDQRSVTDHGVAVTMRTVVAAEASSAYRGQAQAEQRGLGGAAGLAPSLHLRPVHWRRADLQWRICVEAPGPRSSGLVSA